MRRSQCEACLSEMISVTRPSPMTVIVAVCWPATINMRHAMFVVTFSNWSSLCRRCRRCTSSTDEHNNYPLSRRSTVLLFRVQRSTRAVPIYVDLYFTINMVVKIIKQFNHHLLSFICSTMKKQTYKIKRQKYDTIRHDSVYLTCSKKLTGSQLSLPDGMNKNLKMRN